MISHNALQSLKIFSNSLRETKLDKKNIEARSMSQKAVWIVSKNMGNVMMGASHGIGYLQ
jgi:Alcohol dehydrogenase, class IV